MVKIDLIEFAEMNEARILVKLSTKSGPRALQLLPLLTSADSVHIFFFLTRFPLQPFLKFKSWLNWIQRESCSRKFGLHFCFGPIIGAHIRAEHKRLNLPTRRLKPWKVNLALLWNMATMMKPGTICTFNSHLKELPIFDSSSLRPSLRNSGFNHRNVNLKQARNASLVPVIRAQASPGSCFPISLLLFTKTNSWVLNVFSDLVQNTIWVSLSLSFVLFARRLFPGLQVLQGGSNSKVQKLLFISLFHSYVFVLIHL